MAWLLQFKVLIKVGLALLTFVFTSYELRVSLSLTASSFSYLLSLYILICALVLADQWLLALKYNPLGTVLLQHYANC